MKTPGLICWKPCPSPCWSGSILTYSQLSRRSEIPAVRAAGVSAWRFLGPVMVLAVVVGASMVMIIDPLATRLNQDFQAERDRLLGNGRPIETQWRLAQPGRPAGGDATGDETIGSVADRKSQWRRRSSMGRTRSSGAGQALENVTFWYFRPGPWAERAGPRIHPPDRRRARRTERRASGSSPASSKIALEATSRREANLALPTNLSSDTLLTRFASAKTIPFWELPSFIEAGRSAGMEVECLCPQIPRAAGHADFHAGNGADRGRRLPAAGAVWRACHS
jgi:lipopolysaccharide export system permease protein